MTIWKLIIISTGLIVIMFIQGCAYEYATGMTPTLDKPFFPKGFASTEKGAAVRLKDDGTWEYIKNVGYGEWVACEEPVKYSDISGFDMQMLKIGEFPGQIGLVTGMDVGEPSFYVRLKDDRTWEYIRLSADRTWVACEEPYDDIQEGFWLAPPAGASDLVQQAPGSEDAADFRDVKWGMTYAEVNEAEGRRCSGLIDGNVIGPAVEILDRRFELTYTFIDDKLVKAEYHLNEDYLDTSLYVIAFQDMRSALTKKYGKVWLDTPVGFLGCKVTDSPGKLATALLLSKIPNLGSGWRIPKTLILLDLSIVDMRPIMKITYGSIEHSELLQKKGFMQEYKKQQDALKDL